jgi:hypothetical protein
MNPARRIPLITRSLLLALTGVGCAVVSVRAQAVNAAAPDAKTLARYDKNKNGKLDPDELAAQRADESRTAASVAANPSGVSGAKEEVVALSPFEVNAGGDKGYAASSSMSGTRLNSKLEDIASSISVITKQQLLDTAALDLNDIFQYEVGTEGTAQFTDPSNDGRGNYDNVSGNPTGANRIRGLAQAGILVGGFAASSSIPIDPYNIDSVEISRGPNSTTAGLSDAGGSVNLNLSRANLTRDLTSFSTRVDSYDGYRVSMDLNRALLRNKLAFRFSAVYNETGYVRKPSVDRTNRQQFAVNVRPFKKTSINGSFEMFHEFAQRANSLTPRDTITNWRNNGSPTYDWGGGAFAANGTATGGRFTINGVLQPAITTMTNNVPAGIALLGSSNARNIQLIDDGKVYAFMRGGQPNNNAAAVDQFTQSAGVNAAGPLYTLPGTTDRSIYDWTSINIGAQNYQIQRARIYNLSLDQEILSTERQRMNFNAAWRRENQLDYRRQFVAQQDGVPAVLAIDTNARLVDGRPNPFFQHPFIGGLAPQVYVQPNFTDSYRGQLAYQLDFAREPNWMKWLGTHRWTSYGEESLRIYAPTSLRLHDTVVDNPNYLGTAILAPTPTSNFTNANGGLFYPIYYYGKTPGRGVEYANTGPVNPTGKVTGIGSYFNATTNQWVTGENADVEEVYFSQGKQKRRVRTLGGSFQDFWLDGRLVTTLGQREDRTYLQDNLPLPLSNGFLDQTNLDNFGINKKWLAGTTRTKGAVLKPFRGLDFLDRAASANDGIASYFAEAVRGFNLNVSRSNTFLPADLAYNLFLEQLPNPTSIAKEYGFTINMFNKFSLRVTHQETTQVHTRAGTGTVATRVLGMDFHPGGQNLTFNLFDAATGWQQQINPNLTLDQAQVAAAKQIGYNVDFINSAAGKSFADASDAASKGWEVEVQFNPTRYWTSKLTGNQQEAVDSNISLFIQKYINLRLPFWTSVKGPDGALWWQTVQGSNGRPADYYALNIQTPLNLAITTQGKKKPQTREYSFAYTTKYQLAGLTGLSDGHPWLKGAALGGSYRWSSRGAIGYLGGAPDTDGAVRTLDATKPVYDKARDSLSLFGSYRTKLFHDRVGTTFQLNVNNVVKSAGHLQPTAVNPDGSPWRFRIIDPRQFVLSATFDL